MTQDIIDVIAVLAMSILLMGVLVHFIYAWRNRKDDQD